MYLVQAVVRYQDLIMGTTLDIGTSLARMVHDLGVVPCPHIRSAVVDLDDVLLDVSDPMELQHFLVQLDNSLQGMPDAQEHGLLRPLIDALASLREADMQALRSAYGAARRDGQQAAQPHAT